MHLQTMLYEATNKYVPLKSVMFSGFAANSWKVGWKPEHEGSKWKFLTPSPNLTEIQKHISS
jgi:uncharacterized protein (DUF427 family)